ncbi:uracil-DNA glycosylase family protein [Agrococcus sp. SGAir0287]|uniref:uracil-DNA glycosylase family protein n=1 Tax=Agrococcus sp. SGAir0287 TaxID=2070347 RepID=UPI0010CCB668|nr:uracil-DNA glycosylase family protein [Agrococcus sp. SGAir0287]QCR19186.1 uracil-DNA glycosylase [Agrococcus sp. SGAir0287]
MNDETDFGPIEALDALAARWRTDSTGAPRFVPGFDPRSGGARSRVLVLMESPGPATIAAGAAAICSEDNTGPTAAALRDARHAVGLPRSWMLRWNLIPWQVHGRATVAEREAGRAALAELLDTLPYLRVIVTFGTIALDGVMRHFTLADDPTVVPVLAAPHPSPANGRHRHEQRTRAEHALALACEIARRGDGD